MPATYRFADASRPGLLLGLSARQAVPLVAGVLWVALTAQTTAPAPLILAGPAAGAVVAFGRFRGAPLAEVAAPALRLWAARRKGRATWTRAPLLGEATDDTSLPAVLRGLELLETPTGVAGAESLGVVRDTRTGTATAAVRVRGSGFALAASDDQDRLLAAWGAALAPFAREHAPVSQVAWSEWAHTLGSGEHREFLTELGITGPDSSEAVADYLGLVESQGTVTHDVLVALTVDPRRTHTRAHTRTRARRRGGTQVDDVLETLVGEVERFAQRLETAGLHAEPLSALAVSGAIRLRSDPTRARPVTSLCRSLAAAARRAPIEWGPMAVAEHWDHTTVDGSVHRAYRVASWPMLPVAGEWLAPLLTATGGVTRTVTVVMEPIPTAKAARAADREVLAREADAEMKERRGFRVSARDRRRLADVAAREVELTEGHPEFRFTGLIDIAAPDLDALDAACVAVEAAAAQALLDLRPLDARHAAGWVAGLPVGRTATAGAHR